MPEIDFRANIHAKLNATRAGRWLLSPAQL